MNTKGRFLATWIVALVAGCAGASGHAEHGADSEACAAARLDAERRWDLVREGASGHAPAESGQPLRLEAVRDRLEEHRDALRERPDEVDGQLAFALANAMMDGIDEVSGAIPDSLRARAEDAAEALLTDRSMQRAPQVASDAIALIDEIIAEARPDRAAARHDAWSATELERRAGLTVAGYRESVADGDREAARAEALDVADDSLVALRTDAVDASSVARAECGYDRPLAVPSL
ncbi:MAG: hypothetical protein AB7S26_04570 [Sandaracinaceae bacterium]